MFFSKKKKKKERINFYEVIEIEKVGIFFTRRVQGV